MPREYHNSSGQIVLDYAKAIQESVFEQLRVVRDGQLRIVFSPDLKVGHKIVFILHFMFCLPRVLINFLFVRSFGRYALGNFVQGAMKSLSLEDY